MTNSHSSANSGCFSGVLRLILCKGSLQTHPSDQITELTTTTTEFDQEKKDHHDLKVVNEAKVQAVQATPGVVARLMGLESLPDTTNWVPNGRNPDAVTRSRSVNFIDYLLELDLAQAQHRRVRTSVSFREVPAVLDKQNHDFLVVYLDDDDESKTNRSIRSRVRKSDQPSCRNEGKCCSESKNEDSKQKGEARKEKVRQQKKDERRRVSSSNKQFSRLRSCKGAQVSPSPFDSPQRKNVSGRKSGESSRGRLSHVKQEEALVESKFMKKMKSRRAIKDAESDCSSEVSSPLSVLSHSDISLLDEYLLHDDYTKSMAKSLTKTTNLGCPASHPRSILTLDDLERKGIKKNDSAAFGSRDHEFYTELGRTLYQLTEEDIKESNWVAMDAFRFKCSEDISAVCEHQILDLLLGQMVEELAEIH
ncbi:hypothetical protein Tsubulata_019616 [Turnera subulata]|uniref:DUF3741 domain-containing protein n=1 Tax=Turnera subulata TaxID=218843 RepID=A0A9Q0JAF9_9ROSI|nr:hypothetical protein Tsubulata_019616 [Turnera subulata]